MLILNWNFMHSALYFFKEILENRYIINKLALTECRKKYLGSYLGLFWAFAQPVITIFIFWFVFELGFKAAPVKDFPFILWVSAGMVPWFFISESILGGTNSILEHKFLVDKMQFRISMLPLIKIIASFYIHIIFLSFLAMLFAAYGYYPDIYFIQIPYYLFYTLVLLCGITWITSSLIVFIKDMGEAVAICVQFGFWLTPIFWPLNILPEEYHIFVTTSPFYYIVKGYRDCFIYKQWFWSSIEDIFYFWIVNLSILVLGVFLFKKLRPHFADVI